MVGCIIRNRLAAQHKFVSWPNEVHEVNPFHLQVGLHNPCQRFLEDGRSLKHGSCANDFLILQK